MCMYLRYVSTYCSQENKSLHSTYHFIFKLTYSSLMFHCINIWFCFLTYAEVMYLCMDVFVTEHWYNTGEMKFRINMWMGLFEFYIHFITYLFTFKLSLLSHMLPVVSRLSCYILEWNPHLSAQSNNTEMACWLKDVVHSSYNILWKGE